MNFASISGRRVAICGGAILSDLLRNRLRGPFRARALLFLKKEIDRGQQKYGQQTESDESSENDERVIVHGFGGKRTRGAGL